MSISPQCRDTKGQAGHSNTDISIFKNVRNLIINGGSFSLNAPHATTNCPIRTNDGPIYTYGVELDFSVGTDGAGGSRALWSLFLKIRQLMWRLPASHLEVARYCASLGKRHTTTHDLGNNVVSVVGPLFTSWFIAATEAEIQFVVIYLLVSMVVTDILYPTMLGHRSGPSNIVTVLDALGKYHDFPWAVCRNMTTFHEEFLRRSRNQPGFLFIKVKSYEIQYNGHILQQGDWETIQPFTFLFVDFIIIQGEATVVKCPWCETITSTAKGESDVVCTRSQCGRDFSVMDSLQAESPENSFVDDLRIEEGPLPEAILRVRIKYQSSGRQTTNEPELSVNVSSAMLTSTLQSTPQTPGPDSPIPGGHLANALDGAIVDNADVKHPNLKSAPRHRSKVVRFAEENLPPINVGKPAHVLPPINVVNLAHVMPHSYLVFNALIRWNLLDHPSTSTRHLPGRNLHESAFQPHLLSTQISSVHLPWVCRVHASNGHYVTVMDILASLYRHLRTNITQAEFELLLPKTGRRGATRAYEDRYKRLQGVPKETEKRGGMKRIDFLMGSTLFRGLRANGYQWELQVTS